MIISDPSWSLAIRYQKYTDSWQPVGGLKPEETLTSAPNSDFVSLVIDGNDEPHFVWNGYCAYPNCYIAYKKYSDPEKSQIITLSHFIYQTPHISIDSNGHLYVVWNQYFVFENQHYIYFLKYTDSWQEAQKLQETIEASQKYPNLLWSLTNQPKTGFALVFYEGAELKFYASQDLTWE